MKAVALIGIACKDKDSYAIYDVTRFDIHRDILFIADDIINYHLLRTNNTKFELAIYYVDQKNQRQTYLEDVDIM